MRSASILMCLTFLLIPGAATSQEHYRSYDEMTRNLSQLVAAHKDIAHMESLGKTIEQRDIWAITVGGRNADSTHALLVVGGAEGSRILGSELAVRFIEFLLAGAASSDSIAQLVQSTTFFVLPRVNPDATEAFFRKPLYERNLNARPTDDDRDGSVDEDGYEDLNGDGLITMMRVRDDEGEWIIHPEDARLMKKADPTKGQQGRYKLLSEGIDNDKDQRWNEDGPGGVDVNRNFPYNYTFFGRGSGPYQVSEEESRAVANFAFARPTIAVVFTFSSNDNLMNPWKSEPARGSQRPTAQPRRRGGAPDDEEAQPHFVTSVMEDDEQYFASISKLYQDITGFTNPPPSAKGEGAFSDWAYYHFGRWSFAVNPWWIPAAETKKDTASADSARRSRPVSPKHSAGEEKEDEAAEQLKALKWIDIHHIPDAFIPWTKITHPDFPDKEVEVGGFRPYLLTNPPADSIPVLAGKENSFLAALSRKLPCVVLRNVRVEPIDNKVYRLTIDVADTGYFPTLSAMGAQVEWPRNVKVTLGLAGGREQKLASGKAVTILDPIKGSGGYTELSWLVVATPGTSVVLTAESPTAGKATRTISLK